MVVFFLSSCTAGAFLHPDDCKINCPNENPVFSISEVDNSISLGAYGYKKDEPSDPNQKWCGVMGYYAMDDAEVEDGGKREVLINSPVIDCNGWFPMFQYPSFSHPDVPRQEENDGVLTFGIGENERIFVGSYQHKIKNNCQGDSSVSVAIQAGEDSYVTCTKTENGAPTSYTIDPPNKKCGGSTSSGIPAIVDCGSLSSSSATFPPELQSAVDTAFS